MVGFHKITSVSALPDCLLSVRFWDGITKIYDVRQIFGRWPQFRRLLDDDKLYRKVKVDIGGYGIVWDDDLDLSAEELWHNGRRITTVFDGFLALSDASVLWGLSESTLRKAIEYGKFVAGTDVCKFGKQWVVARKAMLREYGDSQERRDKVLDAREGQSRYAR